MTESVFWAGHMTQHSAAWCPSFPLLKQPVEHQCGLCLQSGSFGVSFSLGGISATTEPGQFQLFRLSAMESVWSTPRDAGVIDIVIQSILETLSQHLLDQLQVGGPGLWS